MTASLASRPSFIYIWSTLGFIFGVVFLFSYTYTRKKLKYLYISICSKMLIDIRVRKIWILAFNYTFLGQNRLKLKFECKRKSSFIKQQLCIKLVQSKFCQNRRMNIIDAISVNSSIFFIALLSHSGLKGWNKIWNSFALHKTFFWHKTFSWTNIRNNHQRPPI